MATEEEGGQPGFRWDNWKAWAALSTAEFAIILILAAGLAHLAIRQEGEDWPDGGMLSPLQRANQTIQVAARRWESCRNHTVGTDWDCRGWGGSRGRERIPGICIPKETWVLESELHSHYVYSLCRKPSFSFFFQNSG